MEEILIKIFELYGLKLKLLNKVTEGFLSENYILTDNTTKYFLKKYRFDDESRVKGIHSIKKCFLDGGIPVIFPILTLDKNTFFSINNSYYALFPFVDKKQVSRGQHSNITAKSMGDMLGKIHYLGCKAKIPIIEEFNAFDKDRALEKIRLIENEIAKKVNHDGFDMMALENIQLKRELILENKIKYEELDLPADHLIHGDYLDHNVFFNDDDSVAYVFDFEKGRYAPRTNELFRSMFYSFLDGEVTTDKLAHAKEYLNTYLEIYPMTHDELKRGLKLFYLMMIHGTWVEGEHYLKNNTRVDCFLRPDYDRVRYLSKNFIEIEKYLIPTE